MFMTYDCHDAIDGPKIPLIKQITENAPYYYYYDWCCNIPANK